MNTPICDFVRRYAESGALRLHMPGHKGTPLLGMEALDITEIDGADSLYEAGGIIRESEQNAGTLFGCPTFYSTEGSSQCIRAMLYLALLHAKQHDRPPLVAAGRNAHRTFLSAAALLDLDICWLYPKTDESYLSCRIEPAALDRFLCSAQPKPAAVYLTSPDYLGHVADIAALAKVCHAHGVLLLVDNAHGAYLRFLPQSLHPIDLGADLCCDSAHKTLPVLTGGAYLHLHPAAPALLRQQAKNALALFGSTSPSYLILQSLDAANRYLADGYREKLDRFLQQTGTLKQQLAASGWQLYGDEPLKLTLQTKPFGYRGQELAQLLLRQDIVCEFADPDFLVLMLTPETGEDGLLRLQEALLSVAPRPALCEVPPLPRPGIRAMSVRQAALSPAETLPAEHCIGRVLAAAAVGCPPAVPIAVCGEVIDAHAVECFRYYGIESCPVVL
ncbi:MAG: aminotransferase class I/II-fold pyridoxal phosphate-dependent enzyme [Oscillospiraceae bacterium]|nr:aminotransferase class I/II-fold pyridoxal phosphate-dependent enzyme [Oscillospiraceae bacterium]